MPASMSKALGVAMMVAAANAAPTASSVTTEHGRELFVNGLLQNSLFMQLISTVSPYISVEDLDNFLHQFSGSNSGRQLQSSTSADSTSRPVLTPVSVPPFTDALTDDIAEEASNGWIDQQLWRTFDSTVGTGVRISYVTVRGTGDRGGVIVCPGHGEAIEKYAE